MDALRALSPDMVRRMRNPAYVEALKRSPAWNRKQAVQEEMREGAAESNGLAQTGSAVPSAGAEIDGAAGSEVAGNVTKAGAGAVKSE